MKKILFAIAIALMATVSCNKQNADVDSRLIGTTFITSGYSNITGPLSGIYGQAYQFKDAYHGVMYWTDKNGNKTGDSETFSYILDYPNLSITYDKPESSGLARTNNFIFEDPDTFVLLNDEGKRNHIMTFRKQ